MFVFSCSIDVRPEIKDKIRAEILERTGEACIFVPSELGTIQHICTNKEEATP